MGSRLIFLPSFPQNSPRFSSQIRVFLANLGRKSLFPSKNAPFSSEKPLFRGFSFSRNSEREEAARHPLRFLRLEENLNSGKIISKCKFSPSAAAPLSTPGGGAMGNNSEEMSSVWARTSLRGELEFDLESSFEDAEIVVGISRTIRSGRVGSTDAPNHIFVEVVVVGERPVVESSA